MSPVLVLPAVVSGIVAALAVRAWAATPASRRLWWVAALVGACGAVVAIAGAGAPRWAPDGPADVVGLRPPTGAGGPVVAPLALVVAAAGLAAAAVIDAVERRIPTPLAHGTTLASGLVVVAGAWQAGDRGPLGAAAAGTAAVLVLVVAAWLAGHMGFGDVRLAASATVTASAAGVAGTATFVWGVIMAAGLCLAVLRAYRRLTARRTGAPIAATTTDSGAGAATGTGAVRKADTGTGRVTDTGAGRGWGPEARSGAAPAARLTVPYAPALALGWLAAVVLP